jgi:hypothetical protein
VVEKKLDELNCSLHNVLTLHTWLPRIQCRSTSKGGGQGSRPGLLLKVSTFHMAAKSLGKLKAFQVKEEKVIMEDTVSLMIQCLLM